ncbi:sensor histidine kinase [Georgenia sp. EYE_87]|uniref:sensor histidine kinase n=1 Tax=Georgenia sp. EYE_87 TaxID=2853448 RepID=UPI0020061325|nr:sensor histidine kinase [Georgenia sp. EYE_87]MCK6212402.1 sensor histidine kinase [Georgenia sp. EYE_87]
METIGGVRERLRDPATRRRTVDSLVALLAVLLLGLPSVAAVTSFTSLPAAQAVGAAASLVMCAMLAWRRSRPAASAAAVYAAALGHLLAGAYFLPTDLLVLVALYSVTVYGPLWARRAGLGGALVGALAIAVTVGVVVPGQLLWSTFVLMFLGVAGTVFATWAVALSRRSRIERLEALMERARRLEVERDQEIRLATAAERTRIAREMHDVVAHSLSVVVAQADGGRYAARTDPEAAERALSTISAMGRDALADMRRILGVLRTEDATERLPQPDDADLDRLVEQVRATGLGVSVVRTGTGGSLPPGVGLSVYRIVQEALTNVLKHAGPDVRVTVALHRGPQVMAVQVDDDGRGAAATSDGRGQGLVGMRERAALFGGTVEAGPRPGGGYRVRAEIPLPVPGTRPPLAPRPTVPGAPS